MTPDQVSIFSHSHIEYDLPVLDHALRALITPFPEATISRIPSEYALELEPDDMGYAITFAHHEAPIVIHMSPYAKTSIHMRLHTLIAWLPEKAHPTEETIIQEFATFAAKRQTFLPLQLKPKNGIPNAVSLYSEFYEMDLTHLSGLYERATEMYLKAPDAQKAWQLWAQDLTTRIKKRSITLFQQ
jgi:hypothetical protein